MPETGPETAIESLPDTKPFLSTWAAKSGPVVAAYLVLLLLTRPAYLGDTLRYIAGILEHRQGVGSEFWEFGHALWRPLMSVFLTVFGPLVKSIGHTDEQTALAFIMIAVNVVCGLASGLLMRALLGRFAGPWAAFVGTAAFLYTNAMVDYTRSGSSYVPATTALILGLWLVLKAGDRKSVGRNPLVPAILAGASLAASILFWFPFVLALPAAAVFVFFVLGSASVRERIQTAVVIFAACGFLSASAYASIAYARHIKSVGEFKTWIDSSRNAWAQTDRLTRAVTGVPRSFIDLGDDSMLAKRYLRRDPYNPVSRVQLLSGGLLKVPLFYAFCGIVCFVLLRDPERRWLFGLLLASAGPVLFFAVVLMEPGSTERYLPAYPFLFLLAARALVPRAPVHTAWRALIAAFVLVVICAGNINAKLGVREGEEYRSFLARKQALDARVQPASMVATLDLWDPLYRKPALHLLAQEARLERFHVYDVIEIASERALRWRQEFSERTLASWASGNQVWLSMRLFAGKPKAGWRWVEGDTGRVAWKEIPAFFESLDVSGEVVGAPDGFVLLEHTHRNEERLRSYAAKD